MSKYDPSHDALHVNRVRNTALHIARSLQSEKNPQPEIDLFVIELAALFHDINDKKYSSSEPKSTLDLLTPFFTVLSEQHPELNIYNDRRAPLICKIIDNVSWSTESKLLEGEGGGITDWHRTCLELHCVQDADRLDAIGAMGASGHLSCLDSGVMRPLHNPDNNVQDSAIQHFYDKLLKIQSRLKTDIGRKLGGERHQFMIQFLEAVEREVKL
ncbi:hypothetical protein Clacol_002440 [Clathrus columnatus]|uniref:HD/PDEase domain-containing protein n=1 Tax=Clathrus columnatus TaxID=1419009 RepID=A0AAV5A5F0_9AGAM|nr:hypothetical protein Clacol_002440 [Clathrus columnatus]